MSIQLTLEVKTQFDTCERELTRLREQIPGILDSRRNVEIALQLVQQARAECNQFMDRPAPDSPALKIRPEWHSGFAIQPTYTCPEAGIPYPDYKGLEHQPAPEAAPVPSQPVRLCKTCAHSRFEPFHSSEAMEQTLITGEASGLYYCRVSKQGQSVGAGCERKYGECGPEGKNWTPRPSDDEIPHF